MSVARAFKFGETTYSVEPNGTISTLEGKALTYQKDGDKRRVVLTDGDRKTKVAVHRIMAVVFLDATPHDEIGHKDKDGGNNALSNIVILKTHPHIVAKDVIERIPGILITDAGNDDIETFFDKVAEASGVSNDKPRGLSGAEVFDLLPEATLDTATLPTLDDLLAQDPHHAGRPRYETTYGDTHEALEAAGATGMLNITKFDTSDRSKPLSDVGGTSYADALATVTQTTTVTVSNGYGTFPVTMDEFNSNSYYAKHGFKIVREKAFTGLAKG